MYDLTITSGNTTISSFGDGSAAVSISYKLSAGEDAGKIVVYYLSDSGELVMVQICSYDAATGMVPFITKHFSNYVIGYSSLNFSDVSGWCADYVNYLAAREIINGTGNGKFNPNTNITRAQFVTILANLSGADLSGYTTSSFSDGSFAPTANASRAQAAKMIALLQQGMIK